MNILIFSGELPEADITATAAEFGAMACRIAELAQTGEGESIFPGSGQSALVVRIGSGPALVAVAGDGVLSVSGGPEAVGLFARNMPAEASLPVGYHIHFEHIGREWFVAAESLPLVMTVANA